MFKTKLTQAEYDEIENLANRALVAPNKKEAKGYIDRLAFLASDFQGSVRNIINELCAGVKDASGRVSDKEHKEYFCKMDLYKLRGFILK